MLVFEFTDAIAAIIANNWSVIIKIICKVAQKFVSIYVKCSCLILVNGQKLYRDRNQKKNLLFFSFFSLKN